MNGTRVLGAVCATFLAASIGAVAACGGNASGAEEPNTTATVQAASVSIALVNEQGATIGDGSGVLLASRLVLTSGHLVAGNGKWVVTTADGKKVSGTRGMTYDWQVYGGQNAHPRKHDVGVIYLDEAIPLAAYPKLATERAGDGASATRIRGTGASFETLPALLGRAKGAPNSYLSDVGFESLDTGGAVFDERGIVGVVSGKGLTSGKLYVARTDRLTKWLAPKVAACSALAARTYQAPAEDKSQVICDDAGVPIGSTTSSSGGGAPGTPGADQGGKCEPDDDGLCSGCAGPDAPTSGGNDTGTSPGTDGTSDDEGGAGTNPDGSDDAPGGPGSNPNTGTNPNNGGSNPNTGTNPGGGSNPNQPGGSNGGKPSVGGAGTTPTGHPGTSAGGDHDEACQGPSDNPETCPPEPDGCSGSACGGGQPDPQIDYGNCACSGFKGSSPSVR